MATLVLTAVGTAVAGPLGGALGALAGRSLDSAIFGGKKIEGARLSDLAVTTSSYGAVLPRHYGSVRTAGTVIWATELQETKETSGGSKGKPKVTSYSYSASLAVALGSNQIERVGRIWADGNLLRGEAGDLKVEGALRVYRGDEDQSTDPLISADVGLDFCPAFRGLAYVVFEDLALADFGNRIPALTFEVIGSDGSINLVAMLDDEIARNADIPLDGMLGFTHSGGSFADMLQSISAAWPIACDGSNGSLSIRDTAVHGSGDVPQLPLPVVGDRDEFGSMTGFTSERSQDHGVRQLELRYYDVNRDYQAGLQRSRAKSGNGEIGAIDLPVTMSPDDARTKADSAAMRMDANREAIQYRIAELDDRFYPGATVAVPGHTGLWRIAGWEWRHTGVELDLSSVPPALAVGIMPEGTSGKPQPAADLADGPTVLAAFGLPWDGTGDRDSARIFAAASSPAEGWRGAALYADYGDGNLSALATTGRTPAIMGTASSLLLTGSPTVLDRQNSVVVQLTSPKIALSSTDLAGLARGANRAKLGDEIIQFARAKALGDGRWHLSQLVRGRGGTEQTIGGHKVGEDFILLDERVIPLEASLVGPPEVQSIVALGNADTEPVVSAVSDLKMSLRPYSPVHGRITRANGSYFELTWTRRSRGRFAWSDAVELPHSEQIEAYEVRYLDADTVIAVWRTSEPSLSLDSNWADLPVMPGHFEVRQIGDHALSYPLFIYPSATN
jgi:hypothetical protein